MRGKTSGVSIYLQPNLASGNWEFWELIFRIRAFVFPLQNHPNLDFLHFSGQQGISPSKPGRLAAWCCRDHAVAPRLRARLCAAAWWRAVASPAPGSGRGLNWKREREWGEGDLGFGEKEFFFLQRGEKTLPQIST